MVEYLCRCPACDATSALLMTGQYSSRRRVDVLAEITDYSPCVLARAAPFVVRTLQRKQVPVADGKLAVLQLPGERRAFSVRDPHDPLSRVVVQSKRAGGVLHCSACHNRVQHCRHIDAARSDSAAAAAATEASNDQEPQPDSFGEEEDEASLQALAEPTQAVARRSIPWNSILPRELRTHLVARPADCTCAAAALCACAMKCDSCDVPLLVLKHCQVSCSLT